MDTTKEVKPEIKVKASEKTVFLNQLTELYTYWSGSNTEYSEMIGHCIAAITIPKK